MVGCPHCDSSYLTAWGPSISTAKYVYCNYTLRDQGNKWVCRSSEFSVNQPLARTLLAASVCPWPNGGHDDNLGLRIAKSTQNRAPKLLEMLEHSFPFSHCECSTQVNVRGPFGEWLEESLQYMLCTMLQSLSCWGTQPLLLSMDSRSENWLKFRNWVTFWDDCP